MSLLANEFDLRIVLQGQVSLAAVNQICVIHEAMKGCKKSKGLLKYCFENLNIKIYMISVDLVESYTQFFIKKEYSKSLVIKSAN